MTIDRGPEARSSRRANVFLAAVLHVGGSAFPIRVRNLSPHGALVDGRELPGEGAMVRVQRGPHSAMATVVWCNAKTCGLRFLSAIPVHEWIAYGSGHKGQQRVDEIIDCVRAAHVPGGSAEPPPSDGSYAADRLKAVSEQLEAIAAEFAGIPAVVDEAAASLQRLDIARQTLADLAAVLGDGRG